MAQVMSKYQLLMKSRWLTDKMIRFGLLPSRYGRAIEIYQMVLDYKQINDCSNNQAAEFIADMKKVSRRTVWNIITEMEEEVIL